MGVELLAVGTISSLISLGYGGYKMGNVFSRKSIFNKIAKFVLVKLFNEVKDNDKIKELAESLKNKFKDKKLSELKLFIQDLVGIEKKQKEYNFDTFFTEHREKILANVQDLKEYFLKRQIVEEFSLFVFSRFYDSHINIMFYKDFQDSLIYDFVLESTVSPQELLEKIELVYAEASELDVEKYDVMEQHFHNQQKELLDLVVSLKTKATKKTSRRVFEFLRENLEALTISKEMIVNGAKVIGKLSVNAPKALGSNADDNKSSTVDNQNHFLNKLNEIKANM